MGDGLDDGNLKRRVIEKVSTYWASHDPDGLAAFAKEMAPGKAHTDLTRRLVASWTHVDPEQARARVDELPPGNVRDQAM